MRADEANYETDEERFARHGDALRKALIHRCPSCDKDAPSPDQADDWTDVEDADGRFAAIICSECFHRMNLETAEHFEDARLSWLRQKAASESDCAVAPDGRLVPNEDLKADTPEAQELIVQRLATNMALTAWARWERHWRLERCGEDDEEVQAAKWADPMFERMLQVVAAWSKGYTDENDD